MNYFPFNESYRHFLHFICRRYDTRKCIFENKIIAVSIWHQTNTWDSQFESLDVHWIWNLIKKTIGKTTKEEVMRENSTPSKLWLWHRFCPSHLFLSLCSSHSSVSEFPISNCLYFSSQLSPLSATRCFFSSLCTSSQSFNHLTTG